MMVSVTLVITSITTTTNTIINQAPIIRMANILDLVLF